MENKTKRFLSLVFALVMVFSMLPQITFGASAAESTTTISFASTAQRVSQDGNSQVWKNGDVTFTNNKAASSTAVANYSNPARCYASSEIVIECSGNAMTKIVFDCNTSSYATALKNSIGNAAQVSSDKVTVELDSETSFTVAKLTAQVRMDSLTVTYVEGSSGGGTEEPCTHENQPACASKCECGVKLEPTAEHTPSGNGDVTNPTCIKDGTITHTCAACEEEYTIVGDLATGVHSFSANGICAECYAVSDDVTFNKITNEDAFVSGTYVMVVSTEYAPGVFDNGWVTAVKPTIENGTVTNTAGGLWTLTVGDNNTVTIQDSKGTFIKPKSGENNGIESGSYSWAWSFADGKFTFKGTGSDTTTLASYKSSENKFRSLKNTTLSGQYASQYDANFTLYKLTEAAPECEHKYEFPCSAKCYLCGEGEREVTHEYGYDCSTKCDRCGEGEREVTHTYEYDCSTECKICHDITRPDAKHNFVNGACDICGAEAASPKVVLTGTLNNWNELWMQGDSGTIVSCVIDLPAGTYKFKIKEDSVWMGNSSSFTDTATGLVMSRTAGDCTIDVSGGTYTFTYDFETDTLSVTKDASGAEDPNYGATYVAYIGEERYYTLISAVEAVEDGGIITLIADETFTEKNFSNNNGWADGLCYDGDKSFTIDLGGFTISQNGYLNDYLLFFRNNGEKANTITLKNGTLDAGTTAFCAICTASTNTQKITINLENISLINNISNGSVAKIRGGAELNVNKGTIITGKNSYLGIENWAATVNIYDGAEIYMNGTASYNGSLVGVGGNGTINVYGGYGKGVKGGFIAMTSGGTINVEGGEWIANTDGTYANSNQSVLIAQSDKAYNANAGDSVINVTGGTFKGGYNCYGNAAGDAQLNITGGNFNADPSAYVLADYKVVDGTNGTYDVVERIYIAQIGDKKYEYMSDVLAEVKDGDTITLLTDIEIDKDLDISHNGDYDEPKYTITIDGDGHTITASENWSGKWMADIAWNVNLKNITFDGAEKAGLRGVQFYTSTGVLENVTFKNINNESWCIAVQANTSDLTVKGALTFENCKYGYIAACVGSGLPENITPATKVDTTACTSEVTVDVDGAGVTVVAGENTTVSRVEAKIGNTYYTTLAEAIAAAESGETVTVISDLELTSSYNVPAGVTVTSAEGVKITTATHHTFVLNDGSVLKGLTIVQPTVTGAVNTVYMNSGSKVEGCSFSGQYGIDGNDTTCRAIEVAPGAANIVITGNTFQNLRQPAYVNNGVTGEITNNYADGTKGWVICSDSDVEKITGNTFGTNAVDICIIASGNVDNYSGKVAALSKDNDNATVENQVEKTNVTEDGKLVVKDEFVATGDMTGLEIVLENPNATVKGAEGLNVTTNEGDRVYYDNGIYKVVDTKVELVNMTLEDSFSLNFWVKKSELKDSTVYTAKLTDENGNELGIVDIASCADDSEFFYVSYPGLAAKEMTRSITMQVFANGVAVSNPVTDSLKANAEWLIENTNDEELKIAMIDMLNYGAAAQKEFNYNTGNLANSGLTDEQKALATKSYDLPNAWANADGIGYGSNLELKNEIILHVWFKAANVAAIKVNGVEVGPEKITPRIGNSIMSVAVTDLAVADGFDTVTVEFFDASGNSLGTVTESVASYLKYMLSKSDDTNGLYDATAKFITSSYNYFK